MTAVAVRPVSPGRQTVRTRDLAWVLWQRHRTSICVSVGVTLTIVVGLLVARARLHGLTGCFSSQPLDQTDVDGSAGIYYCSGKLFGRVGTARHWLDAATFAPVLMGVLVAAPLLPREFEQQTYLLTSVSSVSKARWLRAQTVTAIVGSAVLGTAMALAALPLRSALLSFGDPGGVQNGWDWEIWTSGWLLVPYAVSACAIGLLAGALLRRTLPALIVTAVVVTALRVGAVHVVRPHWWTPVRSVTTDLGEQSPAPASALVVHYDLVANAQGHHLRDYPKACAETGNQPATFSLVGCLMAHGVGERITTYQPNNRIGAFEAAEGGTFLLLSAAAMLGIVRLGRRDAPV